jgi:hypothetical protein
MIPKLLIILFSLFFKFLNTPEPQSAIILLQNNHELRATGGFMGSYAKIEQGPTISIQDIYVPDGQLPGHVEPPLAIQQAFSQGWYKLRDANWEPNFPTSAQTIRWFLEKGKEINPDVLITINLSTIENILSITGPIGIDSLGLTLEPDNISLILQNQIKQNFFPGSTNKKDLLTSLSQSLTNKLSSLNTRQKLKVAHLLYQDLKNQDILINSQDPKLQTFLEKRNWAGQLTKTTCKKCLSDTIAIIESNLGSNKANAFITRHTTHTILKNAAITHQITIDYKNTSPSEDPDPPYHHGGNYINYLRFFIPTSATNIQASKDFSLNTKYGFQELAFFHTTPHQSTSSVNISYEIPVTNQKTYQLSILKQSGIGESPQTINLFNKSQEINLTQDITYSTPL